VARADSGGPKGDATRPTADRTREALFSMLVSRLGSFDGLAVADCLQDRALWVSKPCLAGRLPACSSSRITPPQYALRANAEKLGFRPDLRIQSVLTLGVAPQPLDLIMMDPPYGTGAGAVALDKLARLGWTNEATFDQHRDVQGRNGRCGGL
jgi:16S rRNA (guanine966-N2)-methyltransferase